MASKLDLLYRAIEGLDELSPYIPMLTYIADKYNDSSIEISVQRFVIPASQSTDMVLSVNANTETVLSILYVNDGLNVENLAKVQIKANSTLDANLRYCAPRIILTQDITTLRARNAATTAKELLLMKFSITGDYTSFFAGDIL